MTDVTVYRLQLDKNKTFVFIEDIPDAEHTEILQTLDAFAIETFDPRVAIQRVRRFSEFGGCLSLTLVDKGCLEPQQRSCTPDC